MCKTKKITIIVSIYNGEMYLSECIESIINQTYKNLEIILVNDGSNDNSKRIIEYYEQLDSRILFINKSNTGVSDSRNIGLLHSTGEFVTFVDQDDFLDEKYIEYLYELIIKTGADISIIPKVNRFTKEMNNISNKRKLKDKIDVWSGEMAAKQMLYYNLTIGPWSKLIHKKIIFDNGIRFDKRFFGGEGFAFSVQCFEQSSRVAVGQKKLYNYRVDNPNSGMTKFNLSIIHSSIKSQDYIRDSLINKNKEMLRASNYAKWHTYCDCLNTLIGCHKINENRELYNQIKHNCRVLAPIGFIISIPLKEKFKCLFYLFNPYITASLINKFRIRKFSY